MTGSLSCYHWDPHYDIATDFPMFSHNYRCTLLNSTSVSHLSRSSSQWAEHNFYKYFMFSLFLSAAVATVSTPCPTAVLVPFTSIYLSLQSQTLNFSTMVLNLIWLFVVCYTCIIIHSNPIFCSEFWWWIISVAQQIYDLLVLHFLYIFITVIMEVQQ